MRINQNTMAINAYRNLSTNNMSLGKSLEKLSSGFRINRAADDASGLVISQGLRAQIGGLKQATRNAQDGISVVQTAEGALGEVHNILGRMRDLAVQSANTGSSDADARAAAQAEIAQLSAEVERISEQTSFGGQNLLDGTYGRDAVTATGAAFAADVPAANAASLTVDVAGTVVNLGFDGSADVTAAQVGAAVADAVNGAGVSGLSASADAAGAVSYSNRSGSAQTVGDVQGGVATVTGSGGAIAAADADTGKKFQIGANAGETVEVAINPVNTSGLGIDSVWTSPATLRVRSTAIDGAIGQCVGAAWSARCGAEPFRVDDQQLAGHHREPGCFGKPDP